MIIIFGYSILKPKRLKQKYCRITTALVIFTLGISINEAFAQETNQQDDCIIYSIESERNQISISCTKGVTLSDINNAI